MMMKQGNNKIVQCAVVGDGLVGKTSLVMKFLKEKADDTYVATVFDNFAGNLSVAGDKYTVSVFDTAGQQDYEGLRVFTYAESDVILVCFSMMDRESFTNVKEFWVPEVRGYVGSKKSIILVATQADAKKKIRYAEQEMVSPEEGLALADEIGADSFVECSASDGHSVNNVFERVVMSAIKNKKRKMSIIKKLLGK